MSRKKERGFSRGWTPVRKARHSSSGLANAVMATTDYASQPPLSGAANDLCSTDEGPSPMRPRPPTAMGLAWLTKSVPSRHH